MPDHHSWPDGDDAVWPENFSTQLGVIQNYPNLDRRPTCLRFLLSVRDKKQTHIFRVLEFGLKAEVDYYFLQPGAKVRVIGELISEKYVDHKTQAPRNAVTIEARLILFKENCAVERGLLHWRDIEQRERENNSSAVAELPELARKFLKGFGEHE